MHSLLQVNLLERPAVGKVMEAEFFRAVKGNDYNSILLLTVDYLQPPCKLPLNTYSIIATKLPCIFCSSYGLLCVHCIEDLQSYR